MHHQFGRKYRDHFYLIRILNVYYIYDQIGTFELNRKLFTEQQSDTLITSIGWTNIHAEMPLAPAMAKLAAVGILVEAPGRDLVAMVSRESWNREVHLGF